MPRKKSKAVSKGNGPVPQDAYVLLGGTTLEEIRRVISKALDKAFDEPTEEMRGAKKHLADLEQDARRQTLSRMPGGRLAMKADIIADKKTRKRTEFATTAYREKHIGDSSSAQVDPNPMCLTSFGDDSTKHLALPRKEDALVDKGAAPSKPCLSPMEMRTPTAAGGLLPAGTAPSATRTNFYQPPLWFCPTEEINLRASILYATTYSSFWKSEVLQTKARQTMVFDPSGSTGHLHACPFWGTRRALLCGEVFVWTPNGTRGWSVIWQKDDLEYHFSRGVQATRYTKRITVDWCLSAARLFLGTRRSQTAGGYVSCGDNGCQGTPWSERFDGEEFHGALGGECDLEPRGSAVSCTSSTRSQPTFQASRNVMLSCC